MNYQRGNYQCYRWRIKNIGYKLGCHGSDPTFDSDFSNICFTRKKNIWWGLNHIQKMEILFLIALSWALTFNHWKIVIENPNRIFWKIANFLGRFL